MKQTVLVTGGAGYIGSHTCKALAQQGFVPVSFDNLSRGYRSAVKWGPLEIGDIGDRARLDSVFNEHKPVAVIHFAAYTYVGESAAEPLLYYDNNVSRSVTLLEAMKSHGIGQLVFSSSCAIYGIPAIVPIVEDCPAAPISPYGVTKHLMERILRDCSAAHGLRSISLRYFNAAGADRDGEIGENHEPETHLIPLTIQVARELAGPLNVLGTDYPTPDGTAIRDYVHVADLARAHVAALKTLLSGGQTTAINVGSGKGASVLEIVKAVEAVGGRKVKWQAAPRRAGDPAMLLANPALLKAALGLDPATFVPLDEIVRTAWNWHARGALQAAEI